MREGRAPELLRLHKGPVVEPNGPSGKLGTTILYHNAASDTSMCMTVCGLVLGLLLSLNFKHHLDSSLDHLPT